MLAAAGGDKTEQGFFLMYSVISIQSIWDCGIKVVFIFTCEVCLGSQNLIRFIDYSNLVPDSNSIQISG